jgi:hypothetical protein
MMHPELKELWIEALLSGEIPQAKGRLRRTKGMCCLGVLCEVIEPRAWFFGEDGWTWLLDEATSFATNLWADSGDSFPLHEKLGIPGHVHVDLQNMNDQGKSFQEIANYIKFCPYL